MMSLHFNVRFENETALLLEYTAVAKKYLTPEPTPAECLLQIICCKKTIENDALQTNCCKQTIAHYFMQIICY